jgi:hypothetical protein
MHEILKWFSTKEVGENFKSERKKLPEEDTKIFSFWQYKVSDYNEMQVSGETKLIRKNR